MLAFPLSSGVELQAGVIPEDSYSIAALVRFDEITGYRRIVDISSASADRALRAQRTALLLADHWRLVTPPPFEINKYVHVVLTRDAATKRMVAYADGVEQLAFDDTTDAGVFAPGSPVRFFKDDQIITGEESAGAVARIRVYEGALTAAEVADISAKRLADLPVPEVGEDVNVQAASGRVLVAVPSGAARRRRPGKPEGAHVRAARGRAPGAGRVVSRHHARQRRDGERHRLGHPDADGQVQRRALPDPAVACARAEGPDRAAAQGLELQPLPGSWRAGRRGAVSRRAIRRLRANARGRFRTRRRHSAATVRGTVWVTTDRCDGTLTQVKRGKVTVRDLRRKRTITLTAGKSYLAKAR